MIHNKNREKKNKRNIEKLHIRAKRGTDEKKKKKRKSGLIRKARCCHHSFYGQPSTVVSGVVAIEEG